jgi:hypothetical protein
MKVRTKLEAVDDELPFRRFSVTLGDQTYSTPMKASERGSITSPVTELYRSFSPDQLDAVLGDEAVERRVNRDLRKRMGPAFNVFLADFQGRTAPGKAQLEALLDLQYEHSSVVVLPSHWSMLKGLTGERLLTTYQDMVHRSIDIVETLNDKTIVGTIWAKLPRQYLDALTRDLHDRGITSFVVDFDGRSVLSNPSWMRHLARQVSELGIADECVLFSVNSNEGKFIKNADRILAHDFIGSGFGIDVLGLNHLRPRMPSGAWQELRKRRRKNVFRVFDRSDYSYLKRGEDELREMWSAPGADLFAMRRAHNIREQHAEAMELQSRLAGGGTIEPYIRSKALVDEGTMRSIKSIRKDASRDAHARQSFFG